MGTGERCTRSDERSDDRQRVGRARMAALTALMLRAQGAWGDVWQGEHRQVGTRVAVAPMLPPADCDELGLGRVVNGMLGVQVTVDQAA